MFRMDEYVGGALDDGGCGVPKSRGAGDADRDCDRDVISLRRFVLRTLRKRSVSSVAILSVSIGAEGARAAPCE